MDDIDRRLIEVGLRAGGPYGFALAGGHAIGIHGILARPSEDVDLFADWLRRADFPSAVDAIVDVYIAEGHTVEVELRNETFARLYVADRPGGWRRRVELVSNWRLLPPVRLEIGPVLHADDVMAGKMDALFNRAAPRDFLDLDAALSSGRYTGEQLCHLAEQVDSGFDRAMFADALGMVATYPDERFTAYGADVERIAAMRTRFAEWRRTIREQASGPTADGDD